MGIPRIGHGYDVHRFAPNRRLLIGGVDIPYELGLLGHSDADVLTHAVMDALLGSLALGDIGAHFPDTDTQFQDADSIALLRHCSVWMMQKGYVLGNLDATIIAQKPRLAPYIMQMRHNLADALHAPVDRVNVKATTEESLGFTGTGEGIASHCVLLLIPNE